MRSWPWPFGMSGRISESGSYAKLPRTVARSVAPLADGRQAGKQGMKRKETRDEESPRGGAGCGGLVRPAFGLAFQGCELVARHSAIGPDHAPAVAGAAQANILEEAIASPIAEAHGLVQAQALAFDLPGGQRAFLFPVFHPSALDQLPETGPGAICPLTRGADVNEGGRPAAVLPGFELDPPAARLGPIGGLVRPSLDSVFRVPPWVPVGGLLVWSLGAT